VVDVVPRELEFGRQRGRRDIDILKSLMAAGLVTVVDLGDAAASHFEGLVIGKAAETLDDGEAATIAYAVAHGGIAIIDEKKANRICGERFPAVRVASTVDIFAHPRVVEALGAPRLSQALLNALQLARMRVPPHHVEWVVGVIGEEQAALCPSLPRSARSRKTEAMKENG
jgi:hypothetical protein